MVLEELSHVDVIRHVEILLKNRHCDTHASTNIVRVLLYGTSHIPSFTLRGAYRLQTLSASCTLP